MRPYAQAHVQQQVGMGGLVLPTAGDGLFAEKRPASVLTVSALPQLGKLIVDFSLWTVVSHLNPWKKL